MTSRPVERIVDTPYSEDLDQPLHTTDNTSPPYHQHSGPAVTSRDADPSHQSEQHKPLGERPRRSQQSSRSSSDLELEEMGRDDPLYHANGRMSEDTVKLDPGRRSWTDTIFDPAEVQGNSDNDREARRLGSAQFLRKTAINATLIGLWYILSIAMSVYNKWMFSPGNLDFHYPLFTTSVHMIVQFMLASLVLLIFPMLRPSNGVIIDLHDSERSSARRPEPVDPSKPVMTPWFYLTRIVTCGSVTGLDIGLGNTSLKLITLTFFTMCKSSTLGFVLLFAILFRLESPSWKIFGIIAVMTIGVIMMVAGETAFDTLGFVLLMLASFFSGLRWSLTQILLRRTPATSNPFSTLFFLTPVMFAVLFILAVPFEGFSALSTGLDSLAAQKGLFLGICIVLFPGCIAFCMTSAEFALLKRTSVVTLSVCGIFKEVLTITVAGLVFGDELTPINISGLLITIAAIAVYNVTRMRKMRNQEMSKAQEQIGGREENEAMLVASADASQIQEGMAWERPPEREARMSAERSTGIANGLPSLPAALMKRRSDYEEVGQDDRDR